MVTAEHRHVQSHSYAVGSPEGGPTDGLRDIVPEGGSGGTGETPAQLCTISGKSRLRGAAEPLLGRTWFLRARIHQPPVQNNTRPKDALDLAHNR